MTFEVWIPTMQTMAQDSAAGLQSFVPTNSKGTSEKNTSSWSTHDRACSHCRERKIRCGRERPQCANCERDGVECGYYAPGKRVNHIKLLCNNVGSLEDRLCNIEGEISRLMIFLKSSSLSKALLDDETDESTSSSLDDKSNPHESTPTNRHIVRNQADHIDRYHGPCTLFSLCREISEAVISGQEASGCQPIAGCAEGTKPVGGVLNTDIRDLLNQMCLEATIEEPFNFEIDNGPIRLPPKQFLLMVQGPFFEQADFTTDIFVQSNFCSNVERLYGRQYTTADEPWAICFNAIILLVLGSEIITQGHDPLMGSQFSQPFLLAVRTALSNPRVLMAPTLINVQALALLSIATQQYFQPGFAASIFAQACVLARTMGLHQTHVASDGVSPEEAQERFMVFRSLYLRDKASSISRGSICWLPNFDCSLSSEVRQATGDGSKYSSRIQLAMLQEDIYRFSYSSDSQRSSAKHKNELTRIDQSLERWAKTHEIFTSWNTCNRDVVDLQLGFLGTRIAAFRESSDPNHIQRALNDARASCMLLLISYGNYDNAMIERLESLPLSKSPSKCLGRTAASRAGRRKGSNKASLNHSKKQSLAQASPLRFHSLLDTFSVPAFFILARSIMWPMADGTQAEDLNLLQQVCDCYVELEARSQADNYTRKVGHAFRCLLAIVNLVKNYQPPQISPLQSSHSETPNSSQAFNVRTPSMTDFADIPATSTYVAPSLSQDCFLGKATPSGNVDISSTGTSPTMRTPLETDYLGQWYDPLGQIPYSPPYLQQNVLLSGQKGSRLGDTEAIMDDADPGSLSDYMTTGSLMPF